MERVGVYGASFYEYLRERDVEHIDMEFGKDFHLYAREVFCLHDIGRSFIPVTIINKIEKLTEEEVLIIRNHTTYAIQAFESLYTSPFPEDIMLTLFKIALYHHERIDGKGYPEGLDGENIPYCARVCALVDTFDGITSWKPYRAGQITKEDALEIMKKDVGRQFEEKLFEQFSNWLVNADINL